MTKFLLTATGAVAGAVGGLVIVLTIGTAADSGPADSWNYGFGILLFGGMAAGALLGALLGGVAGWNAATGGWRRGGVIFIGSMAGIALLGILASVALWGMIFMPRPAPSDRDRERWAATRGPIEPMFGQSLASSLMTCYSEIRSL